MPHQGRLQNLTDMARLLGDTWLLDRCSRWVMPGQRAMTHR